jgi:hypothetical protein
MTILQKILAFLSVALTIAVEVARIIKAHMDSKEGNQAT